MILLGVPPGVRNSYMPFEERAVAPIVGGLRALLRTPREPSRMSGADGAQRREDARWLSVVTGSMGDLMGCSCLGSWDVASVIRDLQMI